MNLYTSSLTEIGSLRNVSPATAKRIVDLRYKIFAQEHQPLTPEVIGALPGTRLNAGDWQALLDDGIITLQIPKVPPSRDPGSYTDTDLKPEHHVVTQKTTVAQMENYGQTIVKQLNKEMKSI